MFYVSLFVKVNMGTKNLADLKIIDSEMPLTFVGSGWGQGGGLLQIIIL